MNNKVGKFFYQFKGLRVMVKKIMRNRIINQPFHGGVICFNAVDYAFLWVKDASCQKTDIEIQDKLLELSAGRDHFIDIGSNIGIMTLSVGLRNPSIKITAYDPNKNITSYLNKSIKKNKLQDRVVVVTAAVSDKAGIAFMNFATGPYSGHLSDKGTEVVVIDFAAILKEYSDKKLLVKMDIEGFERNLVPILANDKNQNHCFVIEIHPKGLNGISDPDFLLDQLFNNKFAITDVYGKKINTKADIKEWENVVCYYDKDSVNAE